MQMCEAIGALESAFETGDLAGRLASGLFHEMLGPSLLEVYGRLSTTVPTPLHALRRRAVQSLLEQLRHDLTPVRSAYARMCPAQTKEPGVPAQAACRRKWLSQVFDAWFDDGPLATALRVDQMLDARFWGIGFTLETPELCDEFAQELLRSATVRLASDLIQLQGILECFVPKGIPRRELIIVPAVWEQRFEHLMMDILNEHGRHAKQSSLDEDFLEKTDLRVSYQGVRRRRGSRVRVTSLIAPDAHKAKLDSIRHAREFVFLSPLGLAEFALALHQQAYVSPMSGVPLTLPAGFWMCLGSDPEDVPALALELRQIFFRALQWPFDSPLGPLVHVPAPIRQLTGFLRGKPRPSGQGSSASSSS